MECLKFMKDVFTLALRLILKQYYEISYQLIKNPMVQIMSYYDLENWKKSRDNKNFVGTVLMDLSNAFDCIPHDLLAAKFRAYGLSEDAVTFVRSNFKRRKHDVKKWH